jgi:transcriptional regulator with XRE-family HTH domain
MVSQVTESSALIVRRLRHAAGLSQRAFARLVGTSQPAIVRYERGAVAPSWETLERLATAAGQRLEVSVEPVPDPHDVELAELLLERSPEERLRALSRYAHLYELAQEQR